MTNATRLKLTVDRRALFIAPKDDAAGDDCCDRRTAQRPTIKGRVATLGLCTCGLKRPFEIGIDDRHIAPSARSKRAAIREAEDARGIDRAEFDEPCEF